MKESLGRTAWPGVIIRRPGLITTSLPSPLARNRGRTATSVPDHKWPGGVTLWPGSYDLCRNDCAGPADLGNFNPPAAGAGRWRWKGSGFKNRRSPRWHVSCGTGMLKLRLPDNGPAARVGQCRHNKARPAGPPFPWGGRCTPAWIGGNGADLDGGRQGGLGELKKAPTLISQKRVLRL